VGLYQKGTTQIWILLKQETVSGSSISSAICKSAPRSRQITTPATHRLVFTGRLPFLSPNQQCHDRVMNDESGESIKPMEEVPLKELGESELERLVNG